MPTKDDTVPARIPIPVRLLCAGASADGRCPDSLSIIIPFASFEGPMVLARTLTQSGWQPAIGEWHAAATGAVGGTCLSVLCPTCAAVAAGHAASTGSRVRIPGK